MATEVINPHSISFDDDNTWDNWKLVPTTRLHIAPPDVKTEYVEIPGMMGALDYTEALSGRPIFGMRKGSWEFYVLNREEGNNFEWAELYSNILTVLHGNKKKIILREDDPLFYYEGRLEIKSWKSDKERSLITIDYTVDPYKTPILTDEESEWLWDDLFGIAQILYGTFKVNGSKMRTIINSTDTNIRIKTDSNVSMLAYMYESESSSTVVGNPIVIPAGITEDNSQLIVKPGKNKIKFEGYGEIKLYYTKGRSL